jgi:HK97 family phage prohead protease
MDNDDTTVIDPVVDEQQEVETKYLEALLTKANDGSFIAIASTNMVDRHGEVVDNNGWELKAYKQNPVILWGHDHNEPAIGVSKKTWVEGTGKKAKLMIQPLLHDVTEKARAISALVDMGVIKTLSVGFKPLESPDGVTFTKNELLEVSMVNVPANAEARIMAYKGLKEAGFENKTIDDLGINTELLDTITTMQKDIEELQDRVKAPEAVNPIDKTQIIRERLSMTKVITKAADKILEADKKNVPIDQKQLVKTIKRAAEIIAVTEKGKL